MELQERIRKIVKYSNLSIPKFATHVGFKTSQAVRELLNGNTKSLSDAAQYKILLAYPEINPEWLLTGEGEMLKTPTGNNRTAVSEQGIQGTTTVGRDMMNNYEKLFQDFIDGLKTQNRLTDKAMEENAATRSLLDRSMNQTDKAMEQIAATRSLLDRSMNQTDKLISIIQNNFNK